MQRVYGLRKNTMKKLSALVFGLFVLPVAASVASEPGDWRGEIVSLVQHQQFEEAGQKIRGYCIDQKNGELCLVLASAHYQGEAKFGIQTRNIVEAYKYSKLACEYGSEEGCTAAKAAIEKGELLQNVLFEPGIEGREEQLKEAIKLGADLNTTTVFTTTLLQQAISEEKLDVVKLLLDNGVDVNYRVEDEDLTSLMYAINTGNSELVQLLLENGADVTQMMKVPDYLKLGKAEANACDFAAKLKKQEIMQLLKCAVKTASAN